MSTSDVLRQAAELLTTTAAAAWTKNGPWWASTTSDDRRLPLVAVTRSLQPKSATVLFEADWGTEEDARWIALMGPHVAEQLVIWLRSEAVHFEIDTGRGSPFGFPSWHFACLLLGRSPAEGGFDTEVAP